MKLVADANIPLLEQLLPDWTIERLLGRSIGPEHLRDADALLVRSVTRVDRQLLEGSRIGCVGTATAGIDHINLADLEALGIRFAAAPGANARTVVEYLLCLVAALEIPLSGLKLGVVGCGAVGRRVFRQFRDLGCQVLGYDPLLNPSDYPELQLVSLEQVLQSDVVSLHVPLTTEGAYPTAAMIGAEQLAQMPRGAVLVNAARGGVVHEPALLAERGVEVVLDVWQGEPLVPAALHARCRFLTPHMAGYSALAKERGARQVVQALFASEGVIEEEQRSPHQVLRVAHWQQAALAVFNPFQAHDLMADLAQSRQGFDTLRQSYGDRLEFSQLALELPAAQASVAALLGFVVR